MHVYTLRCIPATSAATCRQRAARCREQRGPTSTSAQMPTLQLRQQQVDQIEVAQIVGGDGALKAVRRSVQMASQRSKPTARCWERQPKGCRAGERQPHK